MSHLRSSLFVALFLAVSCAAPAPRKPQPLGTLVVLDKSDADALWFDLDGAKELRRTPTGTGPHEVACRGELGVVCDYGEQVPGSTLTVFDTTDGRLVRKIELGHQRPHGIEWLDERHVLVTSETSAAVLKVDVLSGEVAAVLPTGAKLSHMLCVAPDRSRVYTTNMGSDTASVIDLATGALLAQVPTGKGPEALDISPDGKFLWVGDRSADTLTVIDTEKLERVATLPCAKFPIRLKFTRDGRHVLVSCAQSGDLAVFDARSRREQRRVPMELTPTERASTAWAGTNFEQSPMPIGILVHPTEPVAWIANTNADLVTELSLDTWTVTRRFPTGRQPDGLGHVPAR